MAMKIPLFHNYERRMKTALGQFADIAAAKTAV
jgi:hypothetical protein